MNTHQPNLHTVIFLILFLFVYLIFLLKRAIRSRIDIFDVAMLSSVAVIPAFFVLFPETIWHFSQLLGVGLPVILLFGLLFVIAFVYFFQIVSELNRQRQATRRLIQELSLLRQELEARETVSRKMKA